MIRYPVFIVGSPRSGTSILIRALMKAGYAGYPEGNFLSLMRDLQKAVDRHLDTYGGSDKVLAGRVDRAALKVGLEDVMAAVAAKLQPGAPWVDKTGNPEMIEIIPVLMRIWPSSHFIFAKRRALENLASRVKKFPRFSFEYHCADWARNMAAWRALRADMPEMPGIEIDQHDISSDPAATARRIGTFLQLSSEDVAQMMDTFTRERPQQTEEGSADRVLNLEQVGWTDEQRAVFHRLCDVEMQAFGYSEDTAYRKRDTG